GLDLIAREPEDPADERGEADRADRPHQAVTLAHRVATFMRGAAFYLVRARAAVVRFARPRRLSHEGGPVERSRKPPPSIRAPIGPGKEQGNGEREQGDPGREPRTRPRDPLYPKRTGGRELHHGDHGPLERPLGREEGKDRVAPDRRVGEAG